MKNLLVVLCLFFSVGLQAQTKPLRKNPIFLYFQDNFKKPNPFQPDIAVDITPVIEKKIAGLDAHQSQFYEWLPWVGNYEEEVPKDPSKYKAYLLQKRLKYVNMAHNPVKPILEDCFRC